MLVAVLLVVAGVVVLAGVVSVAAGRARRLARVRAEAAAALGARLGVLAALRRPVNGGRTADRSEPAGRSAR